MTKFSELPDDRKKAIREYLKPNTNGGFTVDNRTFLRSNAGQELLKKESENAEKLQHVANA